MARGEFKLAAQSGDKAYYGIVALDVEPDQQDGRVQIDFDAKRAANWQIGARFGIEYVLEHLPRKKLFPQGLKIRVDRIQGHEVDTTSTVIAYTAAIALLRALGLENSLKPDLDPEKGWFVFPK
jgi:hypothetical protein